MANFVTKRFDDRILGREDSGAAFEQFVDEFLRLEAPDIRLVRGLARGADGAIDLFNADQRLEQIVECKFIGADTNSTAEERWGKVKRILSKNLIPLAQGEEKARKRYRPWLKSKGDLRTYTFVTSSTCASADARHKLRTAISHFLKEQSRQHDELSHLSDVEVDLRYWDDLVGQSAKLAPLFYRWFGGFPQGYGEIAVSFGSETGFKQFLANRNLPYFSLDTYLSETKQKPLSQFDTILQFLTQGNGAQAHVIYGPGGVGKTRLSIELCEKAREAGWLPIRLDRKASVSELDAICQSHADSAKLLLFIDYAEAFEELDLLPEAIARLASDGKHRLSILASTRTSSLQKVTDKLIDLQPETTNLSLATDRNEYSDWLIANIIRYFEIPQGEEIENSCRGLPVMAAFAGFLFRKDRAQFDLQFGNLTSVSDFTGWSSRRLKAIEDRFPEQPVQSLLSELAVRMPMPQTEVISFRANAGLKRDVFDILKADRWIEPEGESYSAAHDVLADAILLRHLSAMPGAEQDRVQDIAVAALKEDRLDRCMAALDRLGGNPVFGKLSGKALVETLMACDSGKTLTVLPSLIKSSLLNPADLIALLASSVVLRTRIAEVPEAHLTLARAAEWAATTGLNEVDRVTAELALYAPLSSAVAFQHPSNIVLRCAHAFDPARFQDEVVHKLRAAPVALDSHYLIVSLLKWGTQSDDVSLYLVPWLAANGEAAKASHVYRAWLDAKGEVDAVREKLLLWVEDHGTTPDAQFVYKAWLDAKGEVDAVREKLLLWVGDHGTTLEAQFVYKAWLDAKGEVDAVCEKLLLWVEDHGTTPEAEFVYKAWLDAKGEVDAVREKLLLWVGDHGTTLEAQFVYKAWLDAKGEVDAVREKLLLWVGDHGTTPEAEFVYKAWLDAKGEVDAVREKLLLWVGDHGTTLEAQFVYKAWLDAKGEVDAVREKLLLWVEDHGTTLEAQFVYKAWLDAKGEVDAVREKLLLWVGDHGTTPEASYVYKAWLDAGQPLEPIKTACEAWLLEHWRSEDAVHVTKELSKAKSLSHDGVACILAWAGTYATSEDAIFRLSRTSRVFHGHAHSPSFTLLVTNVTSTILAHLYGKQRLSRGERDACSILFGNFYKSEYTRDDNWPVIINLYCDGLRHGSVFWHFEGMPRATWEVLLHEAFSQEMLDPVLDAAAIRHAHELILQARSPYQYAELIANGKLSPLPDVTENGQ